MKSNRIRLFCYNIQLMSVFHFYIRNRIRAWTSKLFTLYTMNMKLLYLKENVPVPITSWCVISHIYSVFGVTTKHICIKGLYYFCLKSLKKPWWMVTGSIPPAVSPSTHLMALLESALARHWHTNICSLIQFQINYENTKTQSTTQQTHPSPSLFTGDCDTRSTVNTKTRK